jgi:hypothetical protein
MTPHLTALIAVEHQRELERQAGCCTPLAEHRRSIRRGLRARLAARSAPAVRPAACCA